MNTTLSISKYLTIRAIAILLTIVVVAVVSLITGYVIRPQVPVATSTINTVSGYTTSLISVPNSRVTFSPNSTAPYTYTIQINGATVSASSSAVGEFTYNLNVYRGQTVQVTVAFNPGCANSQLTVLLVINGVSVGAPSTMTCTGTLTIIYPVT